MNSVRTVSATKAAFINAYPRPIASVYRRVVDEIIVELHLVTVNKYFVYDPFFALGVVTVFDALMEAYQPEDQREKIYAALCQALQLRPEVLRQDAETLLHLMKSGDSANLLRLLQQDPEAEDAGGLRGILARMSDSKTYAYSRVLLIGLYTAFEVFAPADDSDKRTQLFLDTISQPLQFSNERVKKDLELYRSNLDKMKQAQTIVEEMVKAARRQQERRTNQPTVSQPETESDPAPAEPGQSS